MVLLTCPSCGLSLLTRHASMAVRYCPRCLARRRTLVALDVAPAGGRARPSARHDG